MIAGDPDARFTYALAHELGQPVSVILDMPAEEVAGWVAYFRIRHKEGQRHGHS